MRESSSVCKDDEDTPVCSTQPRKQRQEKKHTSASIRAGNSTKEEKGMVCTSSKSRHFIKPFSHGLLPMDVLLISVRKGLANADLVDFSAVVLAEVAASQAFLEASSSASRDKMRALAAAKASASQRREKKVE
jgi:hypothetical protein